MLGLKYWHFSRALEWKEACAHSHNWSITLDSVGYSFDFCSMSAHTCFSGFRSCDWWGWVSTSKKFVDNHYLTNFVVCLWSLSCWDMTQDGFKRYHSIVFMTPSWRMLRYRARVIFSSICTCSTPWEVLQPHTNIAPPPCLFCFFIMFHCKVIWLLATCLFSSSFLAFLCLFFISYIIFFVARLLLKFSPNYFLDRCIFYIPLPWLLVACCLFFVAWVLVIFAWSLSICKK